MGAGIVEQIRRIWTPNREVEELLADLSPQTDLDSQIRDFFCRMVQKVHEQGKGPIHLDVTDPNEGQIGWAINQVGDRTIATIWHEP